jgi:hypothetical protein
MPSPAEDGERTFRANAHSNFIEGVRSSDPSELDLLPLQPGDEELVTGDGKPVTDHYIARLATYIAKRNAELCDVRNKYNACENEQQSAGLWTRLHDLELLRDQGIHHFYLELRACYPDWNDVAAFTLRRGELVDDYHLVTTPATRNWLRTNARRYREEDDSAKEWKYLSQLAIYPLRSGV